MSRVCAHHRGLFVACLVLLVGCTEPRFTGLESDAGGELCRDAACEVRSDAARDAAASRDARLLSEPEGGSVAQLEEDGSVEPPLAADASLSPSGDGGTASERARELLIGKYAVRARFYARDLLTGASSLAQEITWLADVDTGANGALQLLAKTCDDHAVNTGGPLQPIRATLLFPDKVAVRRFELVVADESFSTIGEPLLIGYTESVAACDGKAGQTIVGPSGSCVCAPTSGRPPVRANDCRVYDSDEDGHPGYSVELTGGIMRTDYVRHRDMSQMVNGKISADKKHTAIYRFNHDHYTLECGGSATCGVSEYEPCLQDQSDVLFAPLDPLMPSGAEWTCAEILRKSAASELFPLTPLARACN